VQFSNLILDTTQDVATLTLNRPEPLNALSTKILEKFIEGSPPRRRWQLVPSMQSSNQPCVAFEVLSSIRLADFRQVSTREAWRAGRHGESVG
jgi:hypothetical protein